MTVGIVLSNGLEAVLLCDEMVTAGGRQSSSSTKLVTVEGERYNVALVGAGVFNIVSGLIESVPAHQMKEDLNGFVGSVGNWLNSKATFYDNSWLSEEMGNAEKKAEALFSDKAERVQYLNSERGRILQQFDQHKAQQRQNPGVQFLIIAQYKFSRGDAGKVRTFLISGAMPEEAYLQHLEIGSGGDAAQLYLLEQLQGVNLEHAHGSDMAALVAGAYMKSTLNVGVGGTPRIVLMDKTGMRNLGPSTAAFLTNVCGYRFAGALSNGEAKEAVDAAFSANSGDLSTKASEIAQKLDTSTKDLMSATVPLSVIFQRVNWRERL